MQFAALGLIWTRLGPAELVLSMSISSTYQGSSVCGLWPEVDRLRVARLSVVQRSEAGGSWHFGTTLAQAHAETVPSGGHQPVEA